MSRFQSRAVGGHTTKELVGRYIFHVHFVLWVSEMCKREYEAPSGDGVVITVGGQNQISDTDLIDVFRFWVAVGSLITKVDHTGNYRLELKMSHWK